MISNCPPVAVPQSRIVTGRKGPIAAPLPFDGECDLRSTETRETADDVAQALPPSIKRLGPDAQSRTELGNRKL